MQISIHAPREGGDSRMQSLQPRCTLNFNPRPPRGGRLFESFQKAAWEGFQSTPPARGATTQDDALSVSLRISIHAPREGGDYNGLNPTINRYISIHAPREGGD